MVGPELLALVLQNRFLFLPELQSHFLTFCVFKQVFKKEGNMTLRAPTTPHIECFPYLVTLPIALLRCIETLGFGNHPVPEPDAGEAKLIT